MPLLGSSSGWTVQELPDGREVKVPVPPEPASWRCVEVGGSDYYQSDAAPGDEFVAARVVEGTLDAAVDSADSQVIRLVEVSDGVVMLKLAVLDDHIGRGPIAINGQLGAPAARPGVAEEPFKAVLSSTGFGQRFVAQVQDVELVAGVPSHANDSNGLGVVRFFRGPPERHC